jgi:hypothetical protein
MQLLVFLSAFLGSLGVELAEVIRAYQRKGCLPARYRKTGYWVFRLTFALVAGFLPVIFEVTDKIHAFDIGIFAPLIFHGVLSRIRQA